MTDFVVGYIPHAQPLKRHPLESLSWDNGPRKWGEREGGKGSESFDRTQLEGRVIGLTRLTD